MSGATYAAVAGWDEICAWCAYPFDSGDSLVRAADGPAEGAGYCCRTCARKDAERYKADAHKRLRFAAPQEAHKTAD